MRLGLLFCAFALLAPRAAEAQAGSISLSVVRIESPAGGIRDEPTEVDDGVNLADCGVRANTEITIQSGKSPTSQFDLWVSLVDNCEADTTRAGAAQTCFDIGRQVAQLGTNMEITLTLEELVVDTGGGGTLNPCEDIKSPQGSNYYLHVFDSSSESTTGALPANMPRGVVGIPVDVSAPNAPEITSGDVSGEGALDIAFTGAEGDPDFADYEYQLFNVGSCGGGGGGGDAAVVGDGGVAGGMTPISTVSTSPASVRPSALGLAVGESAAVAIRAVDPAGNQSPLSTTVCVTHVATIGYCDAVGECSGSCSVAAPGSSQGAPLTALAGFAVTLGLVVHRLRARERSRRSRA